MTLANRFNNLADDFERRSRNAFWAGAIVFVALTLAATASIIQTFSGETWQIYALAGISLTYCFIASLAMVLSQRRPEQAFLALCLGGCLAVIASASLLAHAGISLAFILIATVIPWAVLSLNRAWGFRLIVLAASAAMLAVLLHYMAPPIQLTLPAARPALVLICVALLLPLVLRVARQYALFTLRTKLILLCILVALIPLALSLQLNYVLAQAVSADPATAMMSFETVMDNALLTGIGIMALTAAVAVWAVKPLVEPLKRLNLVVDKIKSGNFYSDARVEANDEIGALAQTVNQMTDQLRNIWVGLEQRTADRTRASALNAAVSRRLATVTDQRQLFTELADLLREAFNFYHVQICLLDKQRENLVFAGGTGEAGRLMLQGGYQAPLGSGAMGQAVQTNAVVQIADVGRDSTSVPNPLLPDSKVELAVPIASGDRTLGAIDIHKNTLGNVRHEDIELIQSIANQIGIVLRNAQSFAQVQTQANQLTAFSEIVQKIQATTYSEDALQTAAVELNQALNGPRVSWRIRTGNAPEGAPDGGDDTIVAPITFPVQVQGQVGAEFVVEGLTNLNDAASLIGAVAAQMGSHLEKLQLTRQSQSARDQSLALVESAVSFNSAGSLEQILQAAAAPAIAAYANDVLLFIFDQSVEDRPDWMEVRANWVREGSFAIPVGVRFFAATHPASHLWLNDPAAPVFISNLQTDERIDAKLRGAYAQLDVQATAFLPLVRSSRWIGLLVFSWAAPHAFSESEMKLYQALSTQAVLAVQNHLLTSQSQAATAESNQLYQASRHLTSATDLQEIVADVAGNVPIPAVNRAVLITLEEAADGRTMTAQVVSNWHSGRGTPPAAIGEEFKVPAPASKNILLRTEPGYFDDAQLDSSIEPAIRAVFAAQQVRGLAVLPLWAGEVQLGCLLIEADEPHHFTDSEIRPFTSLAQQMAVVIDNRRLMKQTQAAFSETEALYTTSAHLNSVSDIDEVLRALIQPAINSGAVTGGLLTFDLDRSGQPEWGTVAAAWEQAGEAVFPAGTRFHLSDFAISHLWIEDPTHPLFLSDVVNDPRVDPATAEVFEQLQVRSAIWLPLAVGRHWVGIAYVYWRGPRLFSQHERRLFESLSGQAANILEKFLLLGQTQKRAERETVINQINQKIQNATSVEGAVQTAIRELGQVLKARRTVVELAGLAERKNGH